jgi:hypothetical protein
MQPKQMANVLVKILGLSVLVFSIPEILRGMLSLVRAGRVSLVDPVAAVVFVAIGIYLILKSRKVVELLFKNDGE